MKDAAGNWRPQTWGDILKEFSNVPPETPVFEVFIRSATSELKVTDMDENDRPIATGWKGWKARIEKLKEKVEC